MGTQALIHFGRRSLANVASVGEFGAEATVYLQSDGMPEAVLPNLEDFFAEIDKFQPGPLRFTDPGKLAAQYVVWYAKLSSPRNNYLDFGSLRIVNSHPGDIEVEYEISDEVWPDGHPRIAVLGAEEELDLNVTYLACQHCGAVLKPTGEAEISYCLTCGAAG